MLRVFRQYYPIRNIFFVVGEGLIIFLSFSLASFLLLGSDSFVDEQYLLPKILLITFVCQISLYYNDLYDFKISKNYDELCFSMLKAVGVTAII